MRQAVDGQAAVLGFVGAPFTLATYIVEGGSSKNFHNLKRLAFGSPDVSVLRRHGYGGLYVQAWIVPLEQLVLGKHTTNSAMA